jgi:glutamate 5-kinase
MGRGGMGSKIGAARKAAFAGANCIIANGIHIPNITKVFKGEDIGTLFLPSDPPSTTQNFWLSHMVSHESRVYAIYIYKERERLVVIHYGV